MQLGSINFLLARERNRELRETALRRAGRDPMPDSGDTPISRVTLRYAAAADSERLRILAELDSASSPAGPVLVAEVDGRLRAALPLDGGAAIADPFHCGAEMIQLLRIRAAQLAAS
jgi:hypothetical protein